MASASRGGWARVRETDAGRRAARASEEPAGRGYEAVPGQRRSEAVTVVQRRGAGRALPSLPAPRRASTGLPEPLKAGAERLSGLSLDDVRVHHDSPEPARLGALAFTRGTEIHVGPGQGRHLAHETWHVVQQKQGRVRATTRLAGQQLNDDAGLEREADAMGGRAIAAAGARELESGEADPKTASPRGAVAQAVVQRLEDDDEDDDDPIPQEYRPRANPTLWDYIEPQVRVADAAWKRRARLERRAERRQHFQRWLARPRIAHHDWTANPVPAHPSPYALPAMGPPVAAQQAPVQQPPAVQAPVVQAPVVQAPVVQAPVVQAPVQQPTPQAALTVLLQQQTTIPACEAIRGAPHPGLTFKQVSALVKVRCNAIENAWHTNNPGKCKRSTWIAVCNNGNSGSQRYTKDKGCKYGNVDHQYHLSVEIHGDTVGRTDPILGCEVVRIKKFHVSYKRQGQDVYKLWWDVNAGICTASAPAGGGGRAGMGQRALNLAVSKMPLLNCTAPAAYNGV